MRTQREKIAALMREGNYFEALQQIHRLEAETIEDWTYCYLSGECYRMLHNLDYAQFYLAQANAQREGNIEILHSLGMVYEEMGWYKDAIETFKSVVELDPDMLSIYHRIGILYARNGDPVEALIWFDKGLAQIEALYRRGVGSLEEMLHERRRKAMTIFEHVFPHGQIDACSDIEFFKSLFNNDMGVCYMEIGDKHQAEAWFLKSVKSMPERVRFDDPFVYLRKMPHRERWWKESSAEDTECQAEDAKIE